MKKTSTRKRKKRTYTRRQSAVATAPAATGPTQAQLEALHPSNRIVDPVEVNGIVRRTADAILAMIDHATVGYSQGERLLIRNRIVSYTQLRCAGFGNLA